MIPEAFKPQEVTERTTRPTKNELRESRAAIAQADAQGKAEDRAVVAETRKKLARWNEGVAKKVTAQLNAWNNIIKQMNEESVKKYGMSLDKIIETGWKPSGGQRFFGFLRRQVGLSNLEDDKSKFIDLQEQARKLREGPEMTATLKERARYAKASAERIQTEEETANPEDMTKYVEHIPTDKEVIDARTLGYISNNIEAILEQMSAKRSENAEFEKDIRQLRKEIDHISMRRPSEGDDSDFANAWRKADDLVGQAFNKLPAMPKVGAGIYERKPATLDNRNEPTIEVGDEDLTDFEKPEERLYQKAA